MTDSAPLKALKARRRPRGGSARPTPEQMVEQREPGTPPMTRSMPFLFDPAEMPIVIESGGHVPMGNFDQYYVVADHAASQQIVPDGCKTPVSRTLWHRGQRVRRDIYMRWLQDNDLLPVDDGAADEEEGNDG